MFKTNTLKKTFQEMESTLERNIAHDIFQLVFHQNTTDEELMLYYGGGVDRDALIVDTLRKLDGDQRMLKFYQSNKHLLKIYGEKKPTDNFDGIIQRDAVETAGSEGNTAGSTQSGESRSDESDQRSDGPKDNADQESSDRGNRGEEQRSGGELDTATSGNRGNDNGGGETEHTEGDGRGTTAGEAENGSGKITITLPEESEARRLELIRIEDNIGVIEKVDGNDAFVIKYKK